MIKRKILFVALLAILAPHCLKAYDFECDGIYYNITSETVKTCEVTYVYGDTTIYSGEVVIPDSVVRGEMKYAVTAIGENAFAGSYSLSSVSLPNSITSIGAVAFNHCIGLKEITIPKSVTSIGYIAFEDCSNIETVSFSADSALSIGFAAFRSCKALKSLTLPLCAAVSMKEDAFANCTSLASVSNLSMGEIPYGAFTWCTSLTSVSIRTHDIGQKAFYTCRNLSTVVLDPWISTIGKQAFSHIFQLDTLICKNPEPPTIYSNTFDESDITVNNYSYSSPYAHCVLVVPSKYVNAYRNDSNWGKFQNIVGDEAGIDYVTNDPGSAEMPKVRLQEGQIVIGEGSSKFDVLGRCLMY